MTFLLAWGTNTPPPSVSLPSSPLTFLHSPTADLRSTSTSLNAFQSLPSRSSFVSATDEAEEVMEVESAWRISGRREEGREVGRRK